MASEMSNVVSEATSGRTFRRWYWAIRLAAIAIPVVGALPTVMNLYYSYRHGIPFAQVYHKLNQYELWQRNGDCRIDYREISASKGTKVNVGACPSTGDISIKVALASGKQSYEWLSFDQLQRTTWLNLLVSSAHAEGAAETVPQAATAPQASFRVAQAGSQVVCQGWESKERIIRVVNEGGKCFRETIAAFQGRVDKREEVPCTTICPKPAGK